MRTIFKIIFALCWATSCDDISIIPIEGNLAFTDKFIPDASVWLPAAYTGVDGEIEVWDDGNMDGSETI